jgi:effector-binding domain-containing protein
VERVVAVDAPLTSSVLPGGPVASVVHLGPYRELGLVYPSLAVWIHEHGYEFAGSPRSLFLEMTGVAEPAACHTELQWPVTPLR